MFVFRKRAYTFKIKAKYIYAITYLSMVTGYAYKNYKLPKWIETKFIQFDKYVIKRLKSMKIEGFDLVADLHNERSKPSYY